MRLNASTFYGLHRPSECDLRVYLRVNGAKEGEPSPYEEIIRELGGWYEERYLAGLGEFADMRGGSDAERASKTKDALAKGVNFIYQPLFIAEAAFSGVQVTLVGEPDLLIKEDAGYRIRDIKIARRINDEDHPEIFRQLGLYGWLYERTLNQKPTRLEVFSGAGILHEVPLDAANAALNDVTRIVQFLAKSDAPFSPVGWTKCGPCGFNDYCWVPAVKQKNVATISDVDQGLARALREKGVLTVEQLLKGFDESTLSAFERPWGMKTQKIGKKAAKILRFANAISSGKETVLQAPALPGGENFVMFDLEGLPPQLDELDKIYLWGLQVFGTKPGKYLGKIAGVGADGDRAGWHEFLTAAAAVFKEYGDIPFVHWTHYERTKVAAYVERFGDNDGVADRVQRNLVDLFAITRDSVVLPIPSYSLKVVEGYVGYKRSQSEYGGDWAMASFIKATETSDEKKRAELLAEILTYNREDLAATWAVFQWLGGKKPS